MTSRKHYQFAAINIAEAFKVGNITEHERNILIAHFAALFKHDNSRFDYDRFKEAATKQ